MMHLRMTLATCLAVLALAAGSQAQDQTPTPQPAATQLRSLPFARTITAYQTGQVLAGGKIVGGIPTQAGDDPWQVALLVSWIADPVEARYCGGVIRSAYWIQTAGHCAVGLRPEEVQVLAGTTDLRVPGQKVNVSEIIVHDKYELIEVVGVGQVPKNDIALLRLRTPLTFSNMAGPVQAVSATEESTVAAPKTATRVTGFGTLDSGDLSKILMVIEPDIVAKNICNAFASYDGNITEDMFCAGKQAGGADACSGDSGGPLTVRDPVSGTPKLYGLVSWGEGCGIPNKYGVYTRVPLFNDWVQACMLQSANCTRL